MTDREPIASALGEMIDSMLRGINTCMPGQVTAFDRDACTVSVRPCFKMKFSSQDDPVEIPVIENVPVVFQGTTDRWLVFDIEPDSYVLLVFSQRALATWLESGGIVDPTVSRHHHLSDAVAIPGMFPSPAQLSAPVESGEISIRNSDNSNRIALKSDGTIESVNAGGSLTVNTSGQTVANSDVDSAALASAVDLLWSTLWTVFNGWVPVPNDGGAALKTAFLASFPSTPSSVASQTLKVDQ